MKITESFAYFDIVLVALCAITPSGSARVAEFIIRAVRLDGLIGIIAFHAAAIAIAAMICSFARNYRNVLNTKNRRHRLALDLLIVVVFLFVLYKANALGQAGANDIGDSYISYVLSLIFCLGAGYAASDALINTLN